ncbi:MAG: recombination-associated protein RdgC [Methylococcales bacterium]
MASVWYKNVICYRITSEVEINQVIWEELIKSRRHTPILPTFERSTGFVPVFRNLGMELLTHEFNNCLYLSLLEETKKVPPAILNRKVDEKILEAQKNIKDKDGEISKSQKDTIKEEVKQELLKKILPEESITNACIDISNNLLFINAGSAAKAEVMLEQIKKAVEDFTTLPFFEDSLKVFLTNWLLDANLIPASIILGDECTLQSDSKSKASLSKQNLDSDEVNTHLESGKNVRDISLEWDNQLEFKLTEAGHIKRLKPTEMLLTDVGKEISDDGSLLEFYEANYMIMINTFSRLFPFLLEKMPVNK